MSNIKRYSDCRMRFVNGNCSPVGGFCTSVSKEICEAMQSAYWTGHNDLAIEILQKSNCLGCKHFDEEHTDCICYDCKRAYRDRYEE